MTIGNITLNARLAFHDLYAVGGAAGFPQKFSSTLQIAKGSDDANRLIEAIQAVALATWKGEAEQKLSGIWEELQRGVEPKNSNMSMTDGDLINPNYNAGMWVLKASRRENQGPPQVYDRDGNGVFAEADPGAPSKGWGVSVLINVWCQKNQDRINFTVQAVRGQVEGVASIGPSPEAVASENASFLQATNGVVQIPGVVAAPAQLAAPAAARMPAPAAAVHQAPGAPVGSPGGLATAPVPAPVPVPATEESLFRGEDTGRILDI